MKILPTTVVGSHSKPKWLNYLIKQFEGGKLVLISWKKPLMM